MQHQYIRMRPTLPPHDLGVIYRSFQFLYILVLSLSSSFFLWLLSLLRLFQSHLLHSNCIFDSRYVLIRSMSFPFDLRIASLHWHPFVFCCSRTVVFPSVVRIAGVRLIPGIVRIIVVSRTVSVCFRSFVIVSPLSLTLRITYFL